MTVDEQVSDSSTRSETVAAEYGSSLSEGAGVYRQSEIYSRQGVDISRATLAGWVGGASDLLSPPVDACRPKCGHFTC